jgi:hypothetical protein
VPLRLYADECVDGRIVDGLRRRGVDIVTAAEQHLLQATDEAQGARAAELGRLVVTADRDFIELAHKSFAAGGRHAGVIYIKPRAPIGDAIRAIALLAQGLEPAELESRIEWVP